MARHLLARPERRSTLMNGAIVRAEIITDTTLAIGGARQRARLVMVYQGTMTNPNSIWLDERGELLATGAAWFITVRDGRQPLLPALRAIELRWRDARGVAIGKEARTTTNGTIAITNANLFDSETGTTRPGQMIVVRDDRIAAVGATGSVTIPAGATTIDAGGKTVMPGMWDMHTHVQVTSQSSFGLIQLTNGLTTVRDLASDIDV